MMLFIDAHDAQVVNLILISGDFFAEHHFAGENLSEQLITEIKKFLAKQNIKMADLKKIGVVVGPGHFSKIRTAVATANALAYGLQIPVVGIKAGQKFDPLKLLAQKGSRMVKPFYDRQPNITVLKKTA